MKAHALTPSLLPNATSLWPAFGLGLAVAVGNGLARFSYALLLPAMRDALAWSYTQAGWLNTANALGYVIGAVAGYLLLRHFRPAQLFSLGLWLTLASLLLTGLRGDFAWLTATRLLSGIGAAWAFSCGGALIAARYRDTPQIMGIATGLFFSGAGIGIAVAGLAVNPLLAYTTSSGWPYAWMLLGVLAVLLSAWPLREARLSRAGLVDAASPRPLVLRGLIAPLVSYFLFAAGYIVYMTFILAWMRHEGWSWGVATLVWLLLAVSVGLSPFAWRRALEGWTPRLTLTASCAACLLGTAILLFDAGAAGLVVSAIVFGLGVFIAPSSIALLVRRSMEPDQLAKGMTFFTVLFAIGQAIGPVAAGWIGDRGDLGDSLVFGSVLLLVAAALPLLGAKRGAQASNIVREGNTT